MNTSKHPASDAPSPEGVEAISADQASGDPPPESQTERVEKRPDKSVSSPAESAKTWRSGWQWMLRGGTNAAIVITVVVVALLLVGLAQRSGWIRAGGPAGGGADTHDHAGQQTRYICPMMCTPPSSQPGRCPVCGMELVPATGSSQGDGVSVTIEPAARRLVGIQTATSQLESVNRTIRTIGSIDFDESRLATISAYVDGRIEQLYADYVGVRVNRGDDLALIYSPELFSAQTEYVASLESESAGRFGVNDSGLREMAREKLSELGMSEQQILALESSRTPQPRLRLQSPQTGTVLEKAAVEGDYVKTGQTIYRIADLTSVWLMLDLFPDDAAVVRFGQLVEAEIASFPGEVFTGRVAFIDPTVDPKTRTVSVRVEMMNFDGKLRPGDYTEARISVPAVPSEWIYDPVLADKYISPMHPQVIRDEPGACPLCGMDLIATERYGYASQPTADTRVVTVPRDAVLLTGGEGVVYVETEPGRFEIRRVSVGTMTDERAIIVEGLDADEVVATNGNFLIDSQMQLAGNPSLMDPSRAPTYAPGPLQLPENEPTLLTGKAGQQFDRAYAAYFEIQSALASDSPPPPVALNTLVDALTTLEGLGGAPDEAQRRFATARRAASRMDGSLESARQAYRGVSRALLIAATLARGPETATTLAHYHCPMVPGGGGDWMQPGGKLRNPYWGSEMLGCGERVQELGVKEVEVKELGVQELGVKEKEVRR